MLDLDLVMEKIVKSGVIELTTKELLENGLNHYYIKKAILEGALEKVSKGKYRVVKLWKMKERNILFSTFACQVFSNDFKGAYDTLLSNLEYQVDHFYDNHLRTYFILLSKILEYPIEDFKTTERLLEVSEHVNFVGTYYQHFINFRHAVAEEDYEQAFIEIQMYKNLEMKKKGLNKLSTKLFLHLIGIVVFQKDNLKKDRENKNLASDMNVPKKKNIFYEGIYKTFFDQFLVAYQNEKYEVAMEKLNETLKYSSKENRAIIYNLIKLLSTYLEMKKDSKSIQEKKIDYTELKDDYLAILRLALENQDYFIAFENIGKCIDFHPDDSYLRLYREILIKIMEENKKNVTKDIDNPPPTIDISEDILYQLIRNKNYDQAQELLTSYFNNNNNNSKRLYYYLFRMIQNKNDIHDLKKVYKEKDFCYQNDITSVFKRFFEALKYGDYLEAYQCVTVCEEIVQRRDSKDYEFAIYRYIIEDILDEIDYARNQIEQRKKINEVQAKIDSYILSKDFSSEKLVELQKLLLEKINITSDTQKTFYDQYALQVVDVLLVSLENHLNPICFEQFEYQSTHLVTNFFEAMKVGDYVTATKLIMSNDWIAATNGYSDRKYFVLYKKLLAKLSIANNSYSQERKNQENLETFLEEDSFTVVDHLRNLRTIVKKSDYVGAYQYYQEHLAKNISLDSKQFLDVLLPLVYEIQVKEATDMLAMYKQSYNRGEISKAKDYLKQYEELIQQNSLNRNIDYFYSRLESMEKEIETPSFVKKEQLYDYAKYCIENHRYQECIDIMNQYIALDCDLSAKGYLLRGMAFEYLKQYEMAKNDYQKAISIVPEPNAFYRLGKIFMCQKDYLEAEKNLLEFEERKPKTFTKKIDCSSKDLPYIES